MKYSLILLIVSLCKLSFCEEDKISLDDYNVTINNNNNNNNNNDNNNNINNNNNNNNNNNDNAVLSPINIVKELDSNLDSKITIAPLENIKIHQNITKFINETVTLSPNKSGLVLSHSTESIILVDKYENSQNESIAANGNISIVDLHNTESNENNSIVSESTLYLSLLDIPDNSFVGNSDQIDIVILDEASNASIITSATNEDDLIPGLSVSLQPKFDSNDFVEENKSNNVAAGSINDMFVDDTLLFKNTDKPDSQTELFEIRKCCNTDEYFSMDSQSCEQNLNTSIFNSSLAFLVENDLKNNSVTYKTGTVKLCPNKLPPSVLMDLSNTSYGIGNSGAVEDKIRNSVFKKENHCLEMVGTNAENLALTLVFCPYLVETVDATTEYIINGSTENDPNSYVVRKCCGENEFYDTTRNKCSPNFKSDVFYSTVQNISFENRKVGVTSFSQRMDSCPDNSMEKRIISVEANNFRLSQNGDIIEVVSGIRYNYSYYCLEMVGLDSSHRDFTIVLCSLSNALPKCCPTNHYFNEVDLNCLPLTKAEFSSTNILLNYNSDMNYYSLEPLKDYFHCDEYFPVKESALNLYISNGHLCDHETCHEKDKYCIDFIGQSENQLEASSFYCPSEYFIKCCKDGFVFSENGCIPNKKGSSILLQQLLYTRRFRNSFSTNSCRRGKGILIDETLSPKVVWWVSHDGSFLTISSDKNKKKLFNYCIDDFTDKDNKISPSAYVCEEDVSRLLPNEHHFLKYSKEGSLGKCCPENLVEGFVYYFSFDTNDCESMPWNNSLKSYDLLANGKFINEHFHDMPECTEGVLGHHSFSFLPGPYDYAEIPSKGVLKLISRDGKCTKETIVKDRDFCIEYILSGNGDLVPSAFMCAYAPEQDIYDAKFGIKSLFLAISCFFLSLTLVYLFTVKVRRGFVTVKKVSTLAGKILVSFVASNFLGFLSLALTQHENWINRGDTTGCFVLAGFVQFFNLATFCWNTSICLESLLLTMDISISKYVRYILHSLWAWGIPLLLTLLMFVMDAYEDSFPCWVITPKIGVLFCFHSDPNATLVYFYIPILITLIFNLSFLFGAKTMRKLRLKRLEMGPVTKTTTTTTTSRNETGAEGTHHGPSGMRTHQNQNTKTELLRIVLWTGGMWFLELAYILKSYIIGHTPNKWYEYLWYIPISLNSLRGIGIFAIIVLTQEKRKEIQIFYQKTKARFRKIKLALRESVDYDESNRNVNNSTSKNSFSNDRMRNMSVSTMISNLSSSFYNSTSTFRRNDHGDASRKSSITSYFSIKLENLRKNSSNGNRNPSIRKSSLNSTTVNNNSKVGRKYGMARSVSQIDTTAEISCINNVNERQQLNEQYAQRKCSVPLPKVQEEESVFDSENDGGVTNIYFEDDEKEMNTKSNEHDEASLNIKEVKKLSSDECRPQSKDTSYVLDLKNGEGHISAENVNNSDEKESQIAVDISENVSSVDHKRKRSVFQTSSA